MSEQDKLLEAVDRLSKSLEEHSLTQQEHKEHHEYLKAVIEREAQKSAVRKAIIEKTLAGLVWSSLAFAGSWLLNYFSIHTPPH